MTRFRLEGVVQHLDLRPAGNATVRIFDVDSGGNGDDLLIEEQTDARGRFGGVTSKDWEDTNAALGLPVPDVFLLRFEVRQGGRKHEGPFLYVNEDTSVPIVVPWVSEPVPIVVVDGRRCFTPADITAAFTTALRRNTGFTVEVLDQGLVTELGALETKAKRTALINGRLPGATAAIPTNVSNNVIGIDDAIAILLIALAVLLVVGAVALAIGFLVAIFQGREVDWGEEIEIPTPLGPVRFKRVIDFGPVPQDG